MNDASDETSLMDEVPEAQDFLQEVLGNIDQYSVIGDEPVADYIQGILATTSIDAQGEAFGQEALEALVTMVNTQGLWMTVAHDPLIHPQGRFFAAKMFYAPHSRTHFVVGVGGLYDSSKLKRFADFGIETLTHGAILEPEPELEPDSESGTDPMLITIGANPHEIDFAVLEDLLSDAPPSVSREIETHFRKSLDTLLTILTFVIPIAALAKSPFFKKYQEQLATPAAEATLDALRWLKEKVVAVVASKANRRLLYHFSSPYKGSELGFYIDSNDPSVAIAAIDSVVGAAHLAMKLIEHLQPYGVERVAYVFDHRKSKAWLPLYAVTRNAGVITDQPQLISMERFRGLSLGGSAERRLLGNGDGDGE